MVAQVSFFSQWETGELIFEFFFCFDSWKKLSLRVPLIEQNSSLWNTHVRAIENARGRFFELAKNVAISGGGSIIVFYLIKIRGGETRLIKYANFSQIQARFSVFYQRVFLLDTATFSNLKGKENSFSGKVKSIDSK